MLRDYDTGPGEHHGARYGAAYVHTTSALNMRWVGLWQRFLGTFVKWIDRVFVRTTGRLYTQSPTPDGKAAWISYAFVKWLGWPFCITWSDKWQHARVNGLNDRPSRSTTGKATITTGLRLGRFEMLRNLRHYPRAQSQGRHTIDRLEERGVERGSARRSSLKGRERAIVNQTKIETVSKATLGQPLRDGLVERTWSVESA